MSASPVGSSPVRLILVRHGRAEAGWDSALDPGLDGLGRAQAREVAELLAPLGPRPILTSPLRRCRQTAEPLAVAWGVVPVVEPLVAELPSPEGVDVGARTTWLRAAMQGTWSDLGERYLAYRQALVARLLAVEVDTVVVSHFVAINAALGAADGDDRVLIASLDNCSRTVVDVVDGATGPRLQVVAVGAEADTLIR